MRRISPAVHRAVLALPALLAILSGCAAGEIAAPGRVATPDKASFALRPGLSLGGEMSRPALPQPTREVASPRVEGAAFFAPRVVEAAEVWLEAGDWLVWQLTGRLVRSTCQAGYKGMWSASDGWPSEAFLRAVHPELDQVVKRKMPGEMLAPGVPTA